MRWLVLLAAVLLLAGCGKSSPSSPAPTPQSPRNEPPIYLYWGVLGRQLEETQDHCTAVLIPSWWDRWDTPTGRQAIEDQMIALLTEAQTRGFTYAVLAVDFLLWNYKGSGTPAYLNAAELITFRERITKLGLDSLVKGLLILDESDVRGVPDDIMRMACRDAKAAWPGVKIWLTYGDSGRGEPGASEADILARDDYSAGVGVLGKLPALRNGQQWALIPPGSQPWNADPQPYVDFALTHSEVAAVMPFVWFDRTDEQGVQRAGIRSNGLAPNYKAAALSLRANKA